MSGFELASVILRLAAGCWLLWRVPTPRPIGVDRRAWSIVVPARDEAATLPHLLGSLRPELRPGDEVLVVDDDSRDGTAEVAAAGGATVVPAPPLPDGWTGKTWACHTGAGRAGNEVLVFLDADVTVEPGGLGRLAAELEATDGLVSVQPFHDVRRPYERLSAFFNVVALMGSGLATPRRARPIGAFGPVMLTSAAGYRRVGGHAAVAGEVAEDVALGRRYRDAGLPVRLLGGRGTVRFRMYPHGLGSLIEGWSKNIAGGAAATPPARLLLVVAWLSLCITAPLGPWWLYLAVVAQLWWMLRRVGSFGPLTALVYPVPLAFFLGVFGWATVQAARGQVSWRGRKIVRRK